MSRSKVLIVDDDSTLRNAVAELLELEGYRVIAACDGTEALRAMHETCPQLVLLDLEMPGLDGRGFARVLQALGIRVPIIAMSGASEAPRWAREIGALGLLLKPFDAATLLHAVETSS